MSAHKTRPVDWGRYLNRKGLVTRAAINKTTQRIVDLFDPERIILFGSYARGGATPDSDVDMMVIMSARNVVDQMVKIWRALDPPFAFDILVRTPYQMAWRVKEGDWFLREIIAEGRTLYEKPDAPMG